jgi:pyruvate/2-oxoglutarate dehydrogenase complex dihydrolipoamide dehydrogenase (E3) component/uncharacterized membrane protein YdjX (TVP38/TMEM64 family)
VLSRSRGLIFIAAIAMVTAYLYFDLGVFIQFEYLKQRQDELSALVVSAPVKAGCGFFLIYVAVAGLSLPGSAVLTLIGGAIFGLFWGLALASLASTIGATLAFLLSRHLFRNAISSRFQSRMTAIDKGIADDGAFYLFTLRLIPLFPFVVVNLLMGLTSLKTWTFLSVSLIGMLPGTFVFANAGTQLAKIDSLSGILSPVLIASFIALGIFPLVAKNFIAHIKSYRILKPYPKPRQFDRNLIVIGAGAAGLVSSYIAATTKAKITLIEKHNMGGDCLHTGCVPSKALLHSAKLVHQAHHSSRYGVTSADLTVNFVAVMERIKRVIKTIEPHDSVKRYTSLGVECLRGEAKIITPYCVQIGEQRLTARNIIIAAGASPSVPPIPGLDQIDYLTSNNLWDLTELPPRLVVLGGGPVGCEISQAFARLGSHVTQIEMAPRLLMNEDEIASIALLKCFEQDGIDVQLGHRAVEFRANESGTSVVCESINKEQTEPVEVFFDKVVIAVGRRANISGYGLEELGVTLNRDGTIATNEHLATNFPNIYACGDVAGPYQFTHTASHQAWFATVNSLFGQIKRFAVDYSVIPWCTFTDPEIARVGLNEAQARAQAIPYELTTYGLEELDRAITDGVDAGVVRVLTVPGRDKILGVTIVGEHAGDLIAEFVLAMKHGLGLKKILGTIHIYPTLAEANKYVAGAWQREHVPAWSLKFAEWYHRRRR